MKVRQRNRELEPVFYDLQTGEFDMSRRTVYLAECHAWDLYLEHDDERHEPMKLTATVEIK